LRDTLRIGEFSATDAFTSDRSYTLDQLPRLNRIIALKELGFSLEQVEAACKLLGIPTAVSAVSPLMMGLAGLFSPGAKESVEMMYEFTKPFVVDSSHIERELGLKATPIDGALEQTVVWYRERGPA
jgi:DNA-binding transcriptional MerR regulator